MTISKKANTLFAKHHEKQKFIQATPLPLVSSPFGLKYGMNNSPHKELLIPNDWRFPIVQVPQFFISSSTEQLRFHFACPHYKPLLSATTLRWVKNNYSTVEQNAADYSVRMHNNDRRTDGRTADWNANRFVILIE